MNLPKYSHGRFDNFECWAYFDYGGQCHWRGRPWGMAWEDFKDILQDASYIVTNMPGEWARFGP
jgi:hypothetical protein